VNNHDLARSTRARDVGPLPIRPRIAYLPFNEPNQSWTWFEEAVSDLFRRADGYANVEFYGISGDNQNGIDISADSDERGHIGI
jgi:hypothetical protein